MLSHTHYSIEVPAGATQLKIALIGNQDVDLFARFGSPVFNNGHTVAADYGSTTDTGSETIIVTPLSSPALRAGIYYIAVANFGPGDADFTVTATVAGERNDSSTGYLQHRSASRRRYAGARLRGRRPRW